MPICNLIICLRSSLLEYQALKNPTWHLVNYTPVIKAIMSEGTPQRRRLTSFELSDHNIHKVSAVLAPLPCLQTAYVVIRKPE